MVVKEAPSSSAKDKPTLEYIQKKHSPNMSKDSQVQSGGTSNQATNQDDQQAQ